jgi:hypothetical protein
VRRKRRSDSVRMLQKTSGMSKKEKEKGHKKKGILEVAGRRSVRRKRRCQCVCYSDGVRCTIGTWSHRTRHEAW